MSKTQNITISNQSNKIFIYNEPIEDNEKKINEANQTSLITIQLVTPEYHIRINNNFNEKPADKKDMKCNDIIKEHEQHTNVTKHNDSQKAENFKLDEDVLMEGSDGKFYLGTIINSKSEEEYLIRFDDNTEKWSTSCKLKKLTASPTKNGTDSSLCVICKVSKEFDVVEICDKCSRGYHRQCIKEQNVHSSRWNCTRCSFDVISISDSEEQLELDIATEEFNNQKPAVVKLSYDLNSLKWDSAHRSNKENIYCYCGLNGSWKDKMLQCWRCRQWFHGNCVKIWNGYLLHGDTFFIFCCSICNDGNEFIRRLQISWRDIIHLIFYDQSIVRSQKYHSISKDIVPFILKNMDNLFLPPDVTKFLTKELLEKKILQIVRKIDIFKCINANKKKACLFGLRKKMPPLHNHHQKVNIPLSVPFSDELMKKLKVRYVESIEMSCKNKEVSVDAEKKESKAIVATTIEAEMCDSLDETSSNSTLDLIIPPPDNFKGCNNPFHVNYKCDTKYSEKLCGGLKRSQASNKFPEVRIVRTIKRRLSAKDLMLGPNQEVKRRKITKRRKSSDVEVISEIIQPITFPLPPHFSYRPENNSNFIRSQNIVPITKNNNESQKKASQLKKEDVTVKSNNEASSPSVNISLKDTVLNSPVKNNSINLYFGAMHRIENGEKFTILAKRITFDGKQQYLLEWDGKNESVV